MTKMLTLPTRAWNAPLAVLPGATVRCGQPARITAFGAPGHEGTRVPFAGPLTDRPRTAYLIDTPQVAGTAGGIGTAWSPPV